MDTREAGKKGGKATAKNRTEKQRSEAASKAAKARWKPTEDARKAAKARRVRAREMQQALQERQWWANAKKRGYSHE
jgi:hypothetical protein